MMVYKAAGSVASNNGNGGGPAATAMRCITDDIDEFTASLNSVFYPATVVNLAHHSHQSAAELVAARLEHLTIGRARFGSPFEVDPGDLGCYHVNIPLTGTVVSQCGEQQTVARPGHAAVFSPNEHMSFRAGMPMPPRSASRSSEDLWNGNSLHCWGARSTSGSDSIWAWI